MKDARCEVFRNTSKCKEDDCKGCPARFVENKQREHDTEIREKAITEFTEKLCDALSESPLTVVLENRVKADMLTVDGACEIVYEIAEQLKGE